MTTTLCAPTVPLSPTAPAAPTATFAPHELRARALELPSPVALAQVRRLRQQLVAQGWVS